MVDNNFFHPNVTGPYLRDGVADDALDSVSYYAVVAQAGEVHCTHGSEFLSQMIPWQVDLLTAPRRC